VNSIDEAKDNPLNEEYKEICREKLKKIIDKKELYFTKRCNKSIELAVSMAADKLDTLDTLKEKFLLIQEEGGWLTYEENAKKKKLTLVKMKMNDGKTSDERLLDDMNEDGFNNSILLLHSMPGYSYDEDMEKISAIKLKERNILIINDCCGSIGTENAKYGDMIVCSFGNAKPLSIGIGGFIASDNFEEYAVKNGPNKTNKDLLRSAEDEASKIIDFEKLSVQIDLLQAKLLSFHDRAKEVKFDLLRYGFKVLNNKNEGINVLAMYSDESEKERLINYCKEKKIEYTECPRYIRTNKQALSLEIKRLSL
jgi:hypothetical protein